MTKTIALFAAAALLAGCSTQQQAASVPILSAAAAATGAASPPSVLSTVPGQLFCAVQTATGGQLVVGVLDGGDVHPPSA